MSLLILRLIYNNNIYYLVIDFVLSADKVENKIYEKLLTVSDGILGET